MKLVRDRARARHHHPPLDSPANRNALSAGLVAELGDALAAAARTRPYGPSSSPTPATPSARAPTSSPRHPARPSSPSCGRSSSCPARRRAGHRPCAGRRARPARGLRHRGRRRTSSFAFTEVRIGVAPAVISLPLLPRIDPRAAARYYLTGERFDAAEAARIGLLTERGRRRRRGPRPRPRRAAQGLPAGPGRDEDGCSPPRCWRPSTGTAPTSAQLSAGLFASAEAREGMTAFLERRDPHGCCDPRPKQDRSRATRRRLLEAAVSCLAEHGWAGSTVSVVAERAGVSRGAAQHHFPTREDLFTAAVEYVAEERSTALRALRPAGPAADRRSSTALVDLYTGPLFRAALHLWVAASNEAQLRPPRHRTGGPRRPRDPPHRRRAAGRRRVASRASARPCRGCSTWRAASASRTLLTDDAPRRERVVAAVGARSWTDAGAGVTRAGHA